METEIKSAAQPEARAEESAESRAENPSAAGDPGLGFLELIRAPHPDAPDTDPTDRVLSRTRRSAWDF